MATLKKQDENIEKVYADVNFQRLIDWAESFLMREAYNRAGDYIFEHSDYDDYLTYMAGLYENE